MCLLIYPLSVYARVVYSEDRLPICSDLTPIQQFVGANVCAACDLMVPTGRVSAFEKGKSLLLFLSYSPNKGHDWRLASYVSHYSPSV